MNLSIRNLRLRRIAFAALFVAVGVVLSFGVLAIWLGTYPDDVDARNIYYVLWKHGLNNNMNFDYALGAMIGDASRVRQVQGLTKDQLKDRFGYIRTLGEVAPYYQACFFTPGVFTLGNADRTAIAAKSEDAFFLRGTVLGWLS